MKETFRWGYRIYDVSQILSDIESGELQLDTYVVLERSDIEAYCSTVLQLPGLGLSGNEKSSVPLKVNVPYAHELPLASLNAPLLIADVGEGEGVLRLEAISLNPNYVLLDGNHRLVNAFFAGKHHLKAWVLERKQTDAYAVLVDVE